MAMRKDCPKCQASMTEGFVLDVSSDGNKVSRWIEGSPDKHWYGLRIRGKTQINVQTFRCNRCGFLESYAVG